MFDSIKRRKRIRKAIEDEIANTIYNMATLEATSDEYKAEQNKFNNLVTQLGNVIAQSKSDNVASYVQLATALINSATILTQTAVVIGYEQGGGALYSKTWGFIDKVKVK